MCLTLFCLVAKMVAQKNLPQIYVSSFFPEPVAGSCYTDREHLDLWIGSSAQGPWWRCQVQRRIPWCQASHGSSSWFESKTSVTSQGRRSQRQRRSWKEMHRRPRILWSVAPLAWLLKSCSSVLLRLLEELRKLGVLHSRSKKVLKSLKGLVVADDRHGIHLCHGEDHCGIDATKDTGGQSTRICAGDGPPGLTALWRVSEAEAAGLLQHFWGVPA